MDIYEYRGWTEADEAMAGECLVSFWQFYTSSAALATPADFTYSTVQRPATARKQQQPTGKPHRSYNVFILE